MKLAGLLEAGALEAGADVADATEEQAVGVTNDPLLSYGEYPRHDA